MGKVLNLKVDIKPLDREPEVLTPDWGLNSFMSGSKGPSKSVVPRPVPLAAAGLGHFPPRFTDPGAGFGLMVPGCYHRALACKRFAADTR